MKKRLLSVFLSFCMMLTLLPATVLAAEETDSGPAPTDVTEGSASLPEPENGVYTLNADVTLKSAFVVDSEETITIDLNGHTLSGMDSGSSLDGESGDVTQELILNKGTLTIQDSVGGGKISYQYTGTSKGTETGVNTITNRGSLTIESGTIENKTTVSDGQCGYVIDNRPSDKNEKMSLEITGGEITFSGTGYYDGVRLFAKKTDDASKDSVSISGGTVKSVWIQASGDAPYADIEISGGTLGAVYFGGSRNFTISISGGSIESVVCTAGSDSVKGEFISGGTFGSDVSAYLTDGVSLTRDEEGKYTVAEIAIEEFGYILNSETAKEVTGISDCGNYTMYVRFNGELPDDTHLWFVITDPNGKTYGIAGANQQVQAWSFLNKDQFEQWPDGVEPGAPAPGTYTVTVYQTETQLEEAPDDLTEFEELGKGSINVSQYPELIAFGYFLTEDGAEEGLGGEINWEPYTMYVRFGEAFPEGTTLWFKIVDPKGNEYGIAGSESATQAWSFLNKAQFEQWPGDIEPSEIVPGTYTVTIYEYTGEGTISSTNLPEESELKVLTDESLEIGVFLEESTVTFNANGGSVSQQKMTTINGRLADLPTPTRSGSYTFAGWFTEANGGTEITGNTVFTRDMTVYAHWTYNGGGGGGSVTTKYTLSFDTNGGSAIAKVTKEKGTTVDLEQYVPTREGYTFAGWYSDEALTQKVTSVKLNGNTTVYAKWTENAVTPTLPFTDVKTGDWFYEAVQYVYDKGMMTGVSVDRFAPASTTTRGMIVTILYRLENEPAVSGDLPFTDVESGAWYADAVAWAAANDIVNGTSATTFAPNSPITREQMAAILYRYAAYKGYDVSQKADLSGYTDAASISDYAKDALAWANAQKLITGVTDTTLNPQGSATRAQVATILMRLCETVVK